jgi:hypothetical protein
MFLLAMFRRRSSGGDVMSRFDRTRQKDKRIIEETKKKGHWLFNF